MKTIYLAGGCFWGVQKYLDSIHGVLHTQVGYANGHTENPSYEEVCRTDTGHAETVKAEYDPGTLPLKFLLELFYMAIDPTSLNRQGGDTGTQYRTGVYYVDAEDETVIRRSLEKLQKQYDAPIVVECESLGCFFPAENYHQDYLDQNPGGYCHLDFSAFEKARAARVVMDPETGGPVLRFQAE